MVQGLEWPKSIGELQRYFQNRQKENLPKEIPLSLVAAGR